MARIILEIKDVIIEDAELAKFEKKLQANIKYEIEYEGKYAVYAEFGTPALGLRNNMIVELTQIYTRARIPDPLGEATKLANELTLKGKKAQPFLRPALASYTYSMGKQNITDIAEINKMVKNIAHKAEEVYNHNENRSELVKVPLKYTIYMTNMGIGKKSRQKV